MAISEGPFQNVTELFAETTFKMVCVPRASPSTMRFQITRFGGNTFTVDWGDGNPIEYNEGVTPAVTPVGTVIVQFEFDRAKINVLDDEIEDITITGAGTQLESLTLTNQTLLETLSIDDPAKLRFLFCNGSSGLTTVDFGTNDLGNLIDMNFSNCSSLVSFPAITTSPSFLTSSLDGCFDNCSSLTSVGLFDVSGVPSASDMFDLCTSLTSLPAFNFAACTNMNFAFRGVAVVNFPSMQFGASASFSNTFRSNTAMVTFPAISLSNATSLKSAFQGNSNMTTCSAINFSSCTDFDDMFNGCSSLGSLGDLLTEAGTTFDRMFDGCSSLTTIGAIDTTGTDGTSSFMFRNCSSLTSPDSSWQTDLADIDGADFPGPEPTDMDYFVSRLTIDTEYHEINESVVKFADFYIYFRFTTNTWNGLTDPLRQLVRDGFSSTPAPTNGFIDVISPNIPNGNIQVVSLSKQLRVQINGDYSNGYEITADENIEFVADPDLISTSSVSIAAFPNLVIKPDTFTATGTGYAIDLLSIGTLGYEQMRSSTTGWVQADWDALIANFPNYVVRVPSKFSQDFRFSVVNIINPNSYQAYCGGSSATTSNFDFFAAFNLSQGRITITIRLGKAHGDQIANGATFFTDLGITTADSMYLESVT